MSNSALDTIASVMAAWRTHEETCRAAGKRPIDTQDPKLLAGAYLDYAHGNLKSAAHTVGVHASGQYVDMPRFSGCDEVLALLQDLEVIEELAQMPARDDNEGFLVADVYAQTVVGKDGLFYERHAGVLTRYDPVEPQATEIRA